jgi:hypothetical protein
VSIDNSPLSEAQHDGLVGLAAIDLLSSEPAWSIETIAVLFRLSVEDLQARIDIVIAANQRRPPQRTM